MEEEEAMAEVKFENDLFIHDFPRWKTLFSKEAKREEIEENIDWVKPGDDDFDARFLDEIRSLGLKA
jgi:hypothetical protein